MGYTCSMRILIALVFVFFTSLSLASHKETPIKPLGYPDACAFWVDVRTGVAADREAGMDIENSFEKFVIKIAEASPRLIIYAPVHFEDAWDSGLTPVEEAKKTRKECLEAFGHTLAAEI